jgi:hypothetical protein
MAASEALLFKINGTQQTAKLASLKGKTFTIGKVSAAGNAGLSKWMFLHPASSAAGKSTVALKIEGTRQLAQLSGLAGKTVTVGQTPATIGGAGNWLLLNTGKGAALATGTGAAAAKGSSASQMLLVKAEGGRQAVDVTTFAGKSFTVMKPPAMGAGANASNWMFLKPASGAGAAGKDIVAFNVQGGAGTKSVSSLVGKTFTIGKAPMTAGAAGGHQWLAFKPVAGSLASKGAIASTVAFNGKAPLVATPVALNNGTTAVANTGNTAAQTGAGLAGKTSTAAQTAKAVGGGTIWKGTGLSLGLGLGLGAWGPILLVGAAAFGVGVYGYMKNNPGVDADGGDIAELTLEG